MQIQDFLLGPGGRSFAEVEGSFAGVPSPVVNFRGGTGLDWGDDRPLTAGGQTSADVVRLVQKDGSPVAMNTVDAQGNPVSFPAGVGYDDFAWHEDSRTLLVLDFAARDVHVLRPFTDAACPCDSPANINCDGQLNLFDVSAYIAVFNQGCPRSDIACPPLSGPCSSKPRARARGFLFTASRFAGPIPGREG